MKKKKYLDIDVVTAAKQRIRHILDNYEYINLGFSGGKDSTALLYLLVDVLKEDNRPKVDVTYVDHEIEGENIVEILEYVSTIPEINFIWIVVPFKLRNAASSKYFHWYPWNPMEKHLWVRDVPEQAITEVAWSRFEHSCKEGEVFSPDKVLFADDFQDILQGCINDANAKGLSAISLCGVRAEESLARYRIFAKKQNECYISSAQVCYPIYDWSVYDVWKYIRDSKRPYNKDYDLMNKGEYFNQLNRQRVGSILAEESLRTIHEWPLFYGSLWEKILNRAHGVKTAWRYNNEGIYTGTRIEKKSDVSWKEYFDAVILGLEEKTRILHVFAVNRLITWHEGRTDYPITDCTKDACPITGISWEILCKIAIKGDSKMRQLQNSAGWAIAAQKRAKITMDEAVEMYGSDSFKQKHFSK